MLEAMSSPSLITTPEVDGHWLDEPCPGTRRAPHGMLDPKVRVEGLRAMRVRQDGQENFSPNFWNSLNKTSLEISSELTHQEMRSS